MIIGLDHIAIAVPDLGAAIAQYRDALGANVGDPQDEPDHGVTVVFIELPNTKIELLYPLGDDSPIQGFLDKNPSGGIHHVCYEVDDILEAYRNEFDSNKRIAIYRRFQEILNAEQPYTFLWSQRGALAYSRRYKGVNWYPAGAEIREWFVSPDDQVY